MPGQTAASPASRLRTAKGRAAASGHNPLVSPGASTPTWWRKVTSCMRHHPRVPTTAPGRVRAVPGLGELCQPGAAGGSEQDGVSPPSRCGCRASSPPAWVGKRWLNPKMTVFLHRGVGVANASVPGTCGRCGCTGSLGSGLSSSPQLMQW